MIYSHRRTIEISPWTQVYGSILFQNFQEKVTEYIPTVKDMRTCLSTDMGTYNLTCAANILDTHFK